MRVCQQDQMKSIAAKENRRVKQTAPLFKRVAIFRDKHYLNRSVRTLFASVVLVSHFFLKRYVFYRNGFAHAISFK